MKKHTLKRAIQLFAISSFGWVISAQFAFAQVNTAYDGFILGDASPIDIIIAIINWTLAILALIAVVIVLWGGLTWMFSQGDEEKISKAKAILRNGVIGLTIVLAAWGIATYVINLFLDLTDASTADYIPPGDVYEPSDGSPFYVDHSNPRDNEEDVPLCHIVAVTFSYPVNETSITDNSFQVTVAQDAASNPDGGRGNNESCADDVQCLSGICSDSGVCSGDRVEGSFAFSESDYAAVFYPAADYLADTLYEVELSTSVEGINPDTGAVYNLTAGDPKRIFNFTTGSSTDDIPPKVDVTSVTPYPSDGDTDMCLNPTIQVSFSESLDPASPSDENVWLYQDIASGPSDSLNISSIRLTSIGGEADDTIVTSPQQELSEFTEYGLNLYSGDSTTETFEGGIYDTCGNPLSGDFDDDMEGSPIDDFADPTSAGLEQAFCSCLSGTDTCNVAVGADSCAIDADTTCTLDTTCSDTSDDYVGFSYQWTFTTGDEPYCIPDIETISQEDYYYSEDLAPTGATGSEDSGKVLLTGSYLYPFYDLDFTNNMSAAGMNCFDTDHAANMSCFVSNVGSSIITVRTPVPSQTGRISVENNNGSDYSSQSAIIDSPFILNSSPTGGPAGQYVTIRGNNFLDYDPEDPSSSRGQVFFDDVEAEVLCTDGWDDDQIIVRVPDGFAVDAQPLMQVITTEGRYSNQEGFAITDGEPGPGLCEIVPSCSDTGLDDITAVGENFGADGTVYFDPSDGDYVEGVVSQWDVYNPTYASQTVVTDSTPVTERDVYNFTAANNDGISNGLDFEITCSEPPSLLQYFQCDLEADTYYLPNPTNYSDNACVNSVVYFGFTNAMDDTSVENNTAVYRCNNDDQFDDSACTTRIDGSYVSDYLNAAYIGGDSAELLNGTRDIDADGDTDASDAYSAYTFYPDGGFAAGYYYKVDVPITTTNRDGVQLDSDYSWHFQVRDDATNCVADYLALSPATERVNSYDSYDACIDNTTFEGTSYSFRARPATAECLVLDDAGDYEWEITQPASTDILKFGDNETSGDNPGTSTSDTSTIGYNTVCLQGEEEDNDGLATVSASLLDPADGSVAASDSSDVEVDFGYCTQDSDCYTDSCRDTYCDAVTSHCAPDITSFTPDNASGADVGPGGCVSLNGCYFGSSQDEGGSCTCTDLSSEETCTIDEGGVACLLQGAIDSCTLGQDFCTLDSTCSTESASANYDLGFFRGCDCTTTETSPRTCRVAEGETQCEVAGTETCSPTMTASNGTYTAGGSGEVAFDTTTASYPSTVICGDVWDQDQVIVQVPADGSVAPGDYALNLTSYYDLSDTYGTASGDASDCTVGSDPTACLCRVDPDSGHEGDTSDLYGENFSVLSGHNEKVTFDGPLSRVETDGTETWVDDNVITSAVVPDGAVSSDDGVQLESDVGDSNALDYAVSCSSNLDCATGCCSAGQCSSAEICNACENDTDCSYGQCASACVSGTCAPYIYEVSPDTGAVGQPVTFQGCHLGTYYDPSLYTPGSQVTIDGIVADLACNATDSWNNLRVIATIPDGVFSDATTDSALAQIQQVSTSNGTQVAQLSNQVQFNRDDSCSEVNLPVLCDADPAYSPVQTLADSVANIELSGENFNDESDGYCTCTTDLGDCDIDEGGTSCTVSSSTTYYVNPDFSSETCADGSVGAATSNAYSYYDGTLGYCVYTDPDDSSITCNIAVGASTCTISSSDTCYADEADPTTTCTAALSNFTALDGSVQYFDDLEATIDWSQYYSTQYITDVPEGSETGDVQAIATTSAGTQCTSNGLEFPVTCSSCGECGSTRTNALNCNLEYDPAFGSCTADTTGFCRANTGSCCNQTSCSYDSNVSDTEDLGTCEAQPLLEFDDQDADGMSDDYELTLGGYDSTLQDTDGDGTIDSDESGLFNNNNALTTIDSVTYPTPNATDVCSNAEIKIQFNQPITTSDVFNLNDNDVTADDPDTDIDESVVDDLFTDDVAPEDIDFTDYIYLRAATGADPLTNNTTVLSHISISSDGTVLTLERNRNIGFSRDFEIIIRSNDAVVGGTDHHSGIVDAETGVAVGCTTEMDTLGLCNEGYIRYTFTTSSRSVYEDSCGPSYVLLEADSQSFMDKDYTFSESGQEEDMNATVYAVGVDGYADNGLTDANSDGVDDGVDDQPITRIDDGVDAGFWWEYAWDPIYDTLEDLEAAACPVAGIITEDEAGSCSCEITESCTIALGSESCTTGNGVTCYTDSPNAVCDAFDSNYSASGCACTVEDSCTMLAAEASCTTDVNGTDVECSTDSSSAVCDAGDTNWSDGSFIEDEATQTLTSDTPDANADNTDTVTVTVTGSGSVEDGWGNSGATTDDLTDSLLYDFVYCNPDYLVTYSNTAYNFYWSYCRGTDAQSESFLPEFDQVFSRSDTAIDTAYGSDQEFIYEVGFKDTRAATNDPTTNNNIIVLRVYPNDLDADLTTPADAVNPDLWYLLNTNNADAQTATTTVDGYDAVEVGNTVYVAASNLDDTSSVIAPYVYVVAYSTDASEETVSAAEALLDGFKFNRNTTLSDECAIEKSKLVEDTDRVTDLGSVAYLLSGYYYNDSDANDTDDFPALDSGSYISGLTTSVWPSWADNLGDELGQALPTDPTNTFNDASVQCPYDPPDLSIGETAGTYYDESGTCWDPVLKDFNGPAESHVYLYQYQDADNFALYSNLEYDGTGTWISGSYNPCDQYVDGTNVATSISDYSDNGCKTFDYAVDNSLTTDNTVYADLFAD